MFKNIIGSILVAISCVIPTQADSVLLWMFDDPDITEVDGSIIKAEDLVGRGLAEGKQVNAVRVATVGSDGTKVYLDLFESYYDEFGNYNKIDLGNYVEIPIEFITPKDYLAGPAFADLSGLNLDDTSRTFLMEIGFAQFDDDKQVTEWMSMAYASETYQNLREHWSVVDELSMHSGTHWSPAMSVPEPNSAILIFIGSCILMLMRPRKMM